MPIVKRSAKVIAKYGRGCTIRDDFYIPLQQGVMATEDWDQLVPFGKLIERYVQTIPNGKLFPFKARKGYQIVFERTGNFPHFFRSQAQHFYGGRLISDTVKLSKFVGDQNPLSVKSYIGFDATQYLKDKKAVMDFSWIPIP
jgi:hypothetical protein